MHMGLNERRKVKELQETTLPGRVKNKSAMQISFKDGVLRKLLVKNL